MIKKILAVVFCVVLSAGIVVGLPILKERYGLVKTIDDVNISNEVPVISQDVISYSLEEIDYYKVYDSGKLIGIISDKEYFDSKIHEYGAEFAEDFPNSPVGLKDSVYITSEKTYDVLENVDDEIVSYVVNNGLFGIEVSSIEFSDENGIYDIIYVEDVEEFYSARKAFLTNFISEDTLTALENKEKIEDITDFGTVEKDAYIEEKLTVSSATVSPEEVFKSEDEIYEYLCYGRNTSRDYYTIQQGDTLAGIGYLYGDLSPKQIVSLNKGVLTSADQVLNPGTVINVTYFTSPLTVVVTKQRLVQETITPPNPEYIEDNSLEAGKTEIEQNEVVGLQNTLYQETWVNGVLQLGSELSSLTVREPVQGVIRVGVGAQYVLGTGNFIYPTDNAYITCGWACYFMNGAWHNGTDIVDRYNRYGNIYASDSGTVYKVGYDDLSGNYVIIDHNNGYRTYYGHMNTVPFVSEGEGVQRGQLIGQIGMSGMATGPHIHFMIYVDGVKVDACTIMNCDPIR